jgi:hypothetical protein
MKLTSRRSYSGGSSCETFGQADFGAFNYGGYNAIPVFNPVFGGWGFWFFGIWIPLY